MAPHITASAQSLRKRSVRVEFDVEARSDGREHTRSRHRYRTDNTAQACPRSETTNPHPPRQQNFRGGVGRKVFKGGMLSTGLN